MSIPGNSSALQLLAALMWLQGCAAPLVDDGTELGAGGKGEGVAGGGFQLEPEGSMVDIDLDSARTDVLEVWPSGQMVAHKEEVVLAGRATRIPDRDAVRAELYRVRSSRPFRITATPDTPERAWAGLVFLYNAAIGANGAVEKATVLNDVLLHSIWFNPESGMVLYEGVNPETGAPVFAERSPGLWLESRGDELVFISPQGGESIDYTLVVQETTIDEYATHIIERRKLAGQSGQHCVTEEDCVENLRCVPGGNHRSVTNRTCLEPGKYCDLKSRSEPEYNNADCIGGEDPEQTYCFAHECNWWNMVIIP